MPLSVTRLHPSEWALAKRHAGAFHRASNQGGCPAQSAFDSRAGQPRSGQRPFYCPADHGGSDQNRAILETCCGCRSFRRCAAGKSCSRRKPHTAGFDDEPSLRGGEIGAAVRGQGASWCSGGATHRRIPQTRKAGGLPDHPEAFQNRYFPAVFSSPHYTLATMPSDVGRLSSWPDMPSRFRLAVPQPLIREGALRLLADSEHGAAKPMIIPSQFTFATPGAQGFHPALYIDPYRAHPIFEFGDTPLKFHFVEDVTQ